MNDHQESELVESAGIPWGPSDLEESGRIKETVVSQGAQVQGPGGWEGNTGTGVQ